MISFCLVGRRFAAVRIDRCRLSSAEKPGECDQNDVDALESIDAYAGSAVALIGRIED